MAVSPQTILTRSGSEITTPALSHCACGCGTPITVRVWVRRNGSVAGATRYTHGHGPTIRPRSHVCVIPGCDRDPIETRGAHGYCGTHLRRWQRHGDPLACSLIFTLCSFVLTNAGRRAVGLPPRYTEVPW